MEKTLFKPQPFNLVKVILDGSDLDKNPIIKQLRKYRLGLGIKQNQVSKQNPDLFGTPGHVGGLESGRQKENSQHITAYAKTLGIKEITIKF
jgi:hypothetical protein